MCTITRWLGSVESVWSTQQPLRPNRSNVDHTGWPGHWQLDVTKSKRTTSWWICLPTGFDNLVHNKKDWNRYYADVICPQTIWQRFTYEYVTYYPKSFLTFGFFSIMSYPTTWLFVIFIRIERNTTSSVAVKLDHLLIGNNGWSVGLIVPVERGLSQSSLSDTSLCLAIPVGHCVSWTALFVFYSKNIV